MSSSYQALSGADRERRAEFAGEQPSSADLAAKKVAGPPQNPYGEKAPNMNDPRPKKDGADNSPKKDGSKNPPKKTYGPGQAVAGQSADFTMGDRNNNYNPSGMGY
jgi:hypothetical protein